MTLYAWGANSYGQLGLGHKSDEELEPKEVPLKNIDLSPQDIVSIAGGAGHVLILDSKGLLYCCGWNSKGQLGLSDDTLKFTPIEILKEFNIVEISCGWDFSAAVSECGKQFVWGNNQYTQLGLSKSITCTGIPSRLQVSQKLATGFKHVSCGLRHMAMITKEGGLVVAGMGGRGQLGLGDNFDDVNGYLSIAKVPDLEEVRSVASGKHHTLALKEDGTLFSWGENRFGQLGMNPGIGLTFIPLEVFQDEGFDRLYAGWTHSAALTKSGEVFSWGRDTYGQLGCEKKRENLFKPEKIPGLSNVRQLSLGSEHNLAVTSDNKLYSWGWNEHGSCGTGNKKDLRIPTQIFKGRNVKLAFACTGSSFAVVD
ncbi:secretion-regulating guanine nucleotide exchange factor-like [Euwallacea similis]|uniref:secretion-regulating guanine nucleotide exchange factor-like n=1 Tax=Euwallacea similis TaxID=1736056 RepID=UPI00344DAA09